MTPDTPADGEALYDDRTRPLLLQQAETRGAEDWRHEDAEAVIARLLAKIDSLSGALIPRPAEPAQAAQDEGPQNRKLKTCKGCKHFVSEYWREPSGDGETYDSGTSADCTKAGRSISTYTGDEPAPPKWCPFLIAAAQEGRE